MRGKLQGVYDTVWNKFVVADQKQQKTDLALQKAYRDNIISEDPDTGDTVYKDAQAVYDAQDADDKAQTAFDGEHRRLLSVVGSNEAKVAKMMDAVLRQHLSVFDARTFSMNIVLNDISTRVDDIELRLRYRDDIVDLLKRQTQTLETLKAVLVQLMRLEEMIKR